MRRWLAALIAALIVVGVGTSVAVGVGRTSSPAAQRPLPSVMPCAGKAQLRPKSYVLSCADYNSGIYSIHWITWSPQAAIANATYTFNTCVPYCAAGKSVSYPARVRLSSPTATKSGLLFTHITVTYKGQSGKQATVTERLPTTPLNTGTSLPTTTAVPSGVPSAASIQSQLLTSSIEDFPSGAVQAASGGPYMHCGPSGTSECLYPVPSFVTCYEPSTWLPGNNFQCGVFDSDGNRIGSWTVNELPGNRWHATVEVYPF